MFVNDLKPTPIQDPDGVHLHIQYIPILQDIEVLDLGRVLVLSVVTLGEKRKEKKVHHQVKLQNKIGESVHQSGPIAWCESICSVLFNDCGFV